MKKIAALIVFTLATFTNINYALAEEEPLTSGSLSNSFSSWGKPSLQGDWKIISESGKTYLELAENFKAKEGPDVKIFLSPLPASEVNGKNASQGSTFVYLMSEFEGETRIEIPSGIDISAYQSLVFHCEEYSKLWGTSPL